MKNVIISIALLFSFAGLVKASELELSLPMAADGTRIQRSDYGGFDYASSSFSSTFSTACIVCTGAFAGVNFSSGGLGAYDFVDLWDSSSAIQTGQSVAFRIYNVNGSTPTSTNTQGSVSGFNGPKYPIHFKNGLIYKPSVATYNAINILYWALPKQP